MARRWMLLLELAALIILAVAAGWTLTSYDTPPSESIELKVQLAGARDRVHLYRDAQGAYRYRIRLNDGSTRELSPQEFAQRLYEDQRSRSWLEILLNVSSPVGFAWVSLGLLGQALFTGRMVVQWLASERKKASVVPPVFWWMSLIGATMLLVYFLWRKDAVGVLGQGFGWFIYVRNLYFIYARRQPAPVTQDPAPQAELNGS